MGLLAEGLVVAWGGLLVWVWVLFGDGDGWPGVGSCGAGWGVWGLARLDAAGAISVVIDVLRFGVLRKPE